VETVTNVIAFDLGASGGKCFAARFDGHGMALREIHRFSHEPVVVFAPDRGGRLEERSCWDDLSMLREIVQGLRSYRRDVGEHADSVGIDSWGSDGLLVDPDGAALGPLYCYRDHRLDGMVDRVKARMDPARIYAITGIHFQPFNVSNQLLWLVENRPALVRRAARYLPTPTLFSWYLGGVTAVDATWASVSQLMNARTRTWSREILGALGIPRRILPAIVEPGTVVGELHEPLARSIGMNRARIVAVGSHDTASAFIAAPVTRPDAALIISAGTWTLIGRLVRAPFTGPDALSGNLSNEGGIGNVRFLKNCMGSWLVQELRRVWRAQDGVEMQWEEMNRLTERGQPFAAFIDPDDARFYNPPDMEAEIVAYCRRTRQEPPADRGTLLRTVYESLALKYRSVSDLIAGITGQRHAVIHVVGGGSRNAFLNQATANACGVSVLAGPEEATAVGNAVAQAMALGVLRRPSDAQHMIRSAFPILEYGPREREVWEAMYRRFRQVTG
jgi:rhamnulokinase